MAKTITTTGIADVDRAVKKAQRAFDKHGWTQYVFIRDGRIKVSRRAPLGINILAYASNDGMHIAPTADAKWALDNWARFCQ